MNFGSKFVYYYNRSDSESVSDDSETEGTGFDEPDVRVRASAYRQAPVASAGFTKSVRKGFTKVTKAFALRRGRSKALQHDGPSSSPEESSEGVEEDSDTANLGGSATSQAERAKQKKTKKVRKSDPNVFTISVGKYVTPDNLHPDQKVISCEACKAILPAFSKFEAKEGVNNWLCEFCRNYNRSVDVQGWTKPSTDDVTYELEPPVVHCKEQRLNDDYNIIFVIDISGSMSSTETCDVTDSSGRRSRTFVSRLDAVKKAAEHQIRQILEESPNVRVGLVTFGTDVIIYGDGSLAPQQIPQQAMNSQESLKSRAGGYPPLKPISETFNNLTGKLMNLDIKGMTALGPGLLSAISLAANVKGSKVIICTDGCANTGFGTLPSDDCDDEDEISESRAAYKSFGDYARDQSVTVSVISLEGTDCRLVHLGLVAQITGGVVDIVNPRDMTAQFGNILASRTLATAVSVNLVLYHTLYIRDLQTGEQKSTKVEHLGNVSEDSEMIIEFGVKTVANENEEPMTIDDEDQQAVNSSAAESNQSEQMDLSDTVVAAGAEGASAAEAEGAASDDVAGTSKQSEDNETEAKPSELPFQVQIEFTRRDGGKYRRVITNLRECTDKREAAEAEMNMNIVGQATSNTVSNVALAGNYRLAKHAVKSRKKMAERYTSDVMSAGMSGGGVHRKSFMTRQADLDDYVQDLDDLQGLVQRQEKTTKQKQAMSSRYNSYGAAPPPPPQGMMMFGMGAPMIQSAGVCAAPPPPPLQQRSNKIRLQLKSKSYSQEANCITDDLASEYYARSKGSYGLKRQAKQASSGGANKGGASKGESSKGGASKGGDSN